MLRYLLLVLLSPAIVNVVLTDHAIDIGKATAHTQNEQFKKYRTVEAYEIRPGLLMMPEYSKDGQLCQIGLERRHYSSKGINLDSELTQKEIDEIAEELVPVNTRGPQPTDVLMQGSSVLEGNAMETSEVYEMVIIRTYTALDPTHKNNRLGSKHPIAGIDLVGVIQWRNRVCQ